MRQIVLLIFLLNFLAGTSQQIPRWKADSLLRYEERSSGITVINFWATFCKPCVEEIPHFMDVADRHVSEGVSLILVSLDLPDVYPGNLKAFIKKRKYRYPVYWLDESNADYFLPRIDTSWTGSIPSTMILNRKTGYRKFIESSLSEKELEEEIHVALIANKK